MMARRFTILPLAVLLAAACGGSQDTGTKPPGGGDTGNGGGTPAADAGVKTGGGDTGGTDPGQGLGQAPDATVLAEGGAHVQLSSAWLSGTAVLVFSRGHWCPFCIRQLTEFAQNNKKVEEMGAKIVAITSDPEDPPKIREKIKAKGVDVGFTIYSDPDLAAIKAYDVLDAGNNIAKPATVIVDQSGKVVFRYAGDNAADTVLIAVVLSELQKVNDAAKKHASR
ncbi:MAG TPA: peroxiredoxin-like family protein [Kofleriaceae bacterium]|nr:peroxiredoxin-like family protein [Kofleriaceae bacterium]